MKKIISYLRDQHSQLYKVVLLLLCIGAIVYILPKEAKFKYETSNLKGKPWNHENLIAPFDFSIRKSQDQLNSEIEEVKLNSKLYFRLDSLVLFKKLNEYSSSFETAWKQSKWGSDSEKNNSKKEAAFKTGKNLLDSLYHKGIIQVSDAIESKGPEFVIALINGNEEEEYKLGDFYTVQSAYNFAQLKLAKNKYEDLLFPLIENLIEHNVNYDNELTKNALEQAIENISPTYNMVLKDQTIINKGEIVNTEKYQELESLKAEYKGQASGKSNHIIILFGYLLVVAIPLMILFAFLFLFRKDIYANNTKYTFIFVFVTLIVFAVSLVAGAGKFSIYILPFCMLPVVIRAFYDTRVALFTHLITILITAFLVPDRFEFVFVQLVAGIVAIFGIVDMRNRSQIFIASGLIFSAYALSYLGINFINEGTFESINWFDFVWFGISAVLTLFSYPLIFIFEKMFGFLSDVSLLELSDTNSKLLRELSTKAPGTFQHSLQVANLAEDVIYQIGGNASLVRAGALYHDIGKMEMPLYFIENQAGGINPHQDLSFDESAFIIIDHVIKGIEIARKHKLPEQIIDFIRTHHGTTMTWYFYRSFKNAFPEQETDIAKFQYPGPIPFSRETAVLMMADSVEAAARSLKSYDAESISTLVEKIINNQVEQNQFVNSDITFRDITLVKKILKKKLMNIYHVRVEYPR